MSKTKRVLNPERLRQVPADLSWLDHRLVREHYIERADDCAWALYLFLVTVADVDGLSYFADATLTRHLKLDPGRLAQARRDLIAYDPPLHQVLDLPEAVPLTPPQLVRSLGLDVKMMRRWIGRPYAPHVTPRRPASWTPSRATSSPVWTPISSRPSRCSRGFPRPASMATSASSRTTCSRSVASSTTPRPSSSKSQATACANRPRPDRPTFHRYLPSQVCWRLLVALSPHTSPGLHAYTDFRSSGSRQIGGGADKGTQAFVEDDFEGLDVVAVHQGTGVVHQHVARDATEMGEGTFHAGQPGGLAFRVGRVIAPIRGHGGH